MGVAHSLGEGTDAGQAWFLAMTAIVVGPAVILLLVRILGSTLGALSASSHRPRVRAGDAVLTRHSTARTE